MQRRHATVRLGNARGGYRDLSQADQCHALGRLATLRLMRVEALLLYKGLHHGPTTTWRHRTPAWVWSRAWGACSALEHREPLLVTRTPYGGRDLDPYLGGLFVYVEILDLPWDPNCVHGGPRPTHGGPDPLVKSLSISPP
jgi:hypothetical protein